MTFYFSKLWFWWLLAIVLAAILTAWLCHRANRPRKPVVDERHVRELTDARAAATRHEAKVNELLSLRARELDELTLLRAQLARADELPGRLRALEAEAGAVPSLEAEVRTLRAEADRVRPLQDETVALRREIGDLKADNNRLAPLQARLQDLEGEAARGRDAQAELQGLRGRLREAEAETARAGARVSSLVDAPEAGRVPEREARVVALEGELAAALAARPLDTSGARAVLGRAVRADDLKVVEGIGPKIDELLRADGITTWRELAEAPVDRLRAVLAAAGPRFQIHDPGTWPEQASLLLAARWEEFKALTDRLKGGRA